MYIAPSVEAIYEAIYLLNQYACIDKEYIFMNIS